MKRPISNRIARPILRKSIGIQVSIPNNGRAGECIVVSVEAGGTADAAGIRPGDILYAIDGQPLVDLRSILAASKALGGGLQVVLRSSRGRVMSEPINSCGSVIGKARHVG